MLATRMRLYFSAIGRSIHMRIHRSIHMPMHWSIHMPMHRSIHMRMHRSIHCHADAKAYTHADAQVYTHADAQVWVWVALIMPSACPGCRRLQAQPRLAVQQMQQFLESDLVVTHSSFSAGICDLRWALASKAGPICVVNSGKAPGQTGKTLLCVAVGPSGPHAAR